MADENGYTSKVLRLLRQSGGTRQEQGRRFEQVMCKAFEATPQYSQRFDKVWMWDEWPERRELGYKGDIGIDLVAKERDGGLCAIQCKLYDPGHTVGTEGVAKFLAALGGSDFSTGIIVSTADLTQNGYKLIDEHDKAPRVLDSRELDRWPVNWEECLSRPDEFIVKPRAVPRADQEDALASITEGFSSSDRGKLIMPCGTGKSLVSLWAAEREVGNGGRVLYLVPSLALMAQTMRVWAANRDPGVAHRYAAICSDPKAGRRRGDHSEDLSELMERPTTDVGKAAVMLGRDADDGLMEVWFCTYQSLSVLHQAFGHAKETTGSEPRGFDLMICDEAHRTTGIGLSAKERKEGRSPFTMCHDDSYVKASKRLYQTATPRVFTDRQRAQLADGRRDMSDSYSMDDAGVYGDVFYEMTFADAVDLDLVSDYRVLVIGTDEAEMLELTANGKALSDLPKTKEGRAAKIDAGYLTRLLGCWDAMATPSSSGRETGSVAGQLSSAERPLRTAISFSNTVNASKAAAGGRYFSKEGLESSLWESIAGGIAEKHDGEGREFLSLRSDHVDGTARATERNKVLYELEDSASRDDGAFILSNAQLLSEGVDVPALDAVLFLQPKKSAVQVTQAVGRAVRKSPGKQYGYVVIPVVVPDGYHMGNDEVLNGTDFKAVWEVVRALRSHDDRVDYWVNDARVDSPIDIIMPPGMRGGGDGEAEQLRVAELVANIEERIASKMVDVCGDRQMWPAWGRAASAVCKQVKRAVGSLVTRTETATRFDEFAVQMGAAVGAEIDREDAAEMVAQHVVTMPVFDHLFKDSEFAGSNPISVAINSLLEGWAEDVSCEAVILSDGSNASVAGSGAPDGMTAADYLFGEYLAPLSRNYKTMQGMLEASHSPAEKVDLLRQIYDGFFAHAMKKQVEALGIVYTPVEVVDFMAQATDTVCRKHFGKGLTDEGVHVLDPFTGTGTFMYRLLTGKRADGTSIIEDKDLERKFGCNGAAPELHASELVMLAYYIAALKIEAGFAERDSGGDYRKFDGIVLRDTFSIKDFQQEILGSGLSANAARASSQDENLTSVIIGNPPWSSGQDDAIDDNPGISHEHVMEGISETYGKAQVEVTGKGGGGNALGNLYVQAFRWASDRLHRSIIRYKDGTTKIEPGIVAFVTPNSVSTATSLAGMRKALRDEFTDIYVVNLRSDQYKSGKERLAEGAVIFEAVDGRGGSRQGVQITILVANPDSTNEKQPARLHYAEVPSHSSLRDKFDWLAGLSPGTEEFFDKFDEIAPNSRHDWVNITDGSFEELPIELCAPKTTRGEAIQPGIATSSNASGVKTNCDAWLYCFGRKELISKVKALISEYENARVAIHENGVSVDVATANTNPSVIKWHSGMKTAVKRGDVVVFDESKVRKVLYRPFQQMWLYVDHRLISAGSKNMEAMFPSDGIPVTEGGDGETRGDPCIRPERQSTIRRIRSQTAHRPQSHDEGHKGSPEAMLMTPPSGQAIPAFLCTAVLPDLHSIATSHAATRVLSRAAR